MSHMCKRILRFELRWSSYWQNINFSRNCPKFHINRNFSSIFATLLDQLLHPYNFHGRDMWGILFFIFASCEPLILNDITKEAKSNLVLSSTQYYLVNSYKLYTLLCSLLFWLIVKILDWQFEALLFTY